MSGAIGRYGLGGVRVDVRSDAAGIPRWLDEFLLPWFAPEPVADEVWSIDVRCTPRVPDKVHGEPLGDIDVFTRDRGAERLAAWRAADAVVLADARGPTQISVHTARRAVVVTIDRDGARPRSLVMRLVREIICRHGAAKGWLMLHASAAAVGDRAALFLGGKGSGKTTLLSRALVGGAALVANDRVLASVDDSRARILGCPTIVRVRPDGPARVPGLRPPDFGGDHRYYLTLAECRQDGPLREPTDRDPPSMSPAQCAAWHGAEVRTTAHPVALVFPRVVPGVTNFHVEPLTAAECERMLHACVIVPASGTLLGRGAAPGPPATMDGLALAVPGYRLDMGPGAYGPAGAWDAVVELLAAR
ncbi:MAG: hypothetical protein KIT68_03215 [Phycisphaeraceae bacterium]|nr:hypothetical protein [Phycisphaeraceae bacterium]